MLVHCAGLLGLIGDDAGDVFRPSCSTLAAEVQLSARYFTTVGLLLHTPRIQQNAAHTKLSHVGTKSRDPCTGCGLVFLPGTRASGNHRAFGQQLPRTDSALKLSFAK